MPVRLGMQIASGVFANAKIQCEESVSSCTPQNRAEICRNTQAKTPKQKPYRGMKVSLYFSVSL